MMDEKYIELINREIDNEITPDEKVRLHYHLAESKTAQGYYEEMKLTCESLNRINDPLPSENLKKQIVNSIDFNRYTPKPAKAHAWNLNRIFSLRTAYTFAAGLIAGIIIYSLFTMNSGNIPPDEVSGTIGVATKAVTVKEIPINLPSLKGNIAVQEQGSNFRFIIYSSSSQPVDFIISYPDEVQFESIKPAKTGDIKIFSGKNYIKTSISGSQQYTLMFSSTGSVPSPVHLSLVQSGNTIYECNLTLNR
jgi:hypothetical protein